MSRTVEIADYVPKDAAKDGTDKREETLRGLVASACIFLITNRNKDPRKATPEEILEVLGIGAKCSPKEIATAFASLAKEGAIERIIRERRDDKRRS